MSRRWPVPPAAFALGLLTGRDLEQAEALAATDPEFRDAVAQMRATGDALEALPDDAWQREPAPAPPLAPELDLPRVLAARPPAPTRASRRRRWGPVLRVRPAVAALCAAALLAGGIAVGAALRGGDGDSGGRTPPAVPAAAAYSLAPLDRAAPHAGGKVLIASNSGGSADFTVRGLPATRPGTYYEAWLMTDAKRLAALGTFVVGTDGQAHAHFTLGADPHRFLYVDVSLQHQSDGSDHSGESVLRAPII